MRILRQAEFDPFDATRQRHARRRRKSNLAWVMAGAIACLLGNMGCAQASHERPAPIHPQALRPGDTIAFVAPASPLDRPRMELARERLEQRGYRVLAPPDLYRARGYLAGTDEARAAELMAAFRNSEVKAIFPGTGGYGITRMLDRLDYGAIQKNPKIVVGFSDLTALHLAIQKKCNLITFHSPNPMYGLGNPANLAPFSARYFWRALTGNDVAAPAEEASHDEYVIELPAEVPPLKILRPGVARGRLTGGNLSLVVALMGTPYEIETAGRVLFLEDVGERPYRIDRCLSQLKLAGKLDAAAGVILGQFRDCAPKLGEESLSLDEVFADYFSDAKVPVLANFPAGHATNNATLPFGAMVEVDADRARIRICEAPVR